MLTVFFHIVPNCTEKCHVPICRYENTVKLSDKSMYHLARGPGYAGWLPETVILG